MILKIGYLLAFTGVVLSLGLPNAASRTANPLKSKRGKGYECNLFRLCPGCSTVTCHPIGSGRWSKTMCNGHYVCVEVPDSGSTCNNFGSGYCSLQTIYSDSQCTQFVSQNEIGTFAYCGI